MTAAGHSAPIETNVSGGIGETMTIIRTELRTILKLACKVVASCEMIIRPQRAGLPNGVTAREPDCLTYLHPIRVFHNETYIAGQMTNKSICSEPVFAAREHSVCGFGPIGELMAADLHRADAQPDITGSVLEQELESLHSRAGIEVMEMCVSCGFLSVVPAELFGEGAS